MKGPSSDFDFNAFVPYPQKYKDLDDEAKAVSDKRSDMVKKLMAQGTKEKPAREKALKKFPLVRDGYNQGGYQWCRENWGTKWNACDAYIASTVTDKDLVIGFSTAWSPPVPVIKAMAMKFPDNTFKLCYREGGCGFEGTFKVRYDHVIIDRCKDL